MILLFIIKKKDFIYLLFEREEGREYKRRREGRERNINMQEIHRLVASHMPSTGDLARNPGMCPDRELNW